MIKCLKNNGFVTTLQVKKTFWDLSHFEVIYLDICHLWQVLGLAKPGLSFVFVESGLSENYIPQCIRQRRYETANPNNTVSLPLANIVIKGTGPG